MLGRSLNSNTSVISRGIAGTPGNSGNSGGHQRGLVLELSQDLNHVLIHQEIILYHLVQLKRNQIKIPLRLARVTLVLTAFSATLQIISLQELFKRKLVQLGNCVRRQPGVLRLRVLDSKLRMPSGIKQWDPSPACSPLYTRLRDFILHLRNPPHMGANRGH